MSFSPASKHWLVTMAATATALGAPTAVLSQETEFEEIVVTGTRKGGQSPTETLSPVDLLSGELLSDQAAFDLTDGLPKITPSLNTQRFPIADGTAFIRPVTLRNLSPDHTLVLMNGTRRHRSALVNLQLAPLGTVNQGSQGVDFAAFPAAAIERVEILRDGAAAQYGSDAIAGVVNIILKDASEGGSLSAQYGEYYESDGERLSVSGNIGLPLGADGFANLSAEYSESDITSRGHPRPDAAGVRRDRRQRPHSAGRARPALGRSRCRGAEVRRQCRRRHQRQPRGVRLRDLHGQHDEVGLLLPRAGDRRRCSRRASLLAPRCRSIRRRRRPTVCRIRRRSRWSTASSSQGLRPERLSGRRRREPERLRAAQPDLHRVSGWLQPGLRRGSDRHVVRARTARAT